MGRPASREPTRTERLAVRVTPELRELVEAAAKRDQRSVSDWINLVLQRSVEAPAPTTKKR